MALRIRKGDVVEVRSGDHRGARGKILWIDAEKGKVVVEGVNLVYRHVRPTQKNPQGGRVQKEAPLHLSNVLPYDSAKGKGVRVRFEVERGRGGQGCFKASGHGSRDDVAYALARGEGRQVGLRQVVAVKSAADPAATMAWS